MNRKSCLEYLKVQAGFYVKGVRLTNFTVLKLQLGFLLTNTWP